MSEGTGMTPLEDLSQEQTDKSNAPVNDVFRQVYTKLDEEQVNQMKEVKELSQNLWDKLNDILEDGERSERARLINIGKTQLEIAIAVAVKGITSENK